MYTWQTSAIIIFSVLAANISLYPPFYVYLANIGHYNLFLYLQQTSAFIQLFLYTWQTSPYNNLFCICSKHRHIIIFSVFAANIGLDENERLEVFTTIAAVLHIGNIAFEVMRILSHLVLPNLILFNLILSIFSRLVELDII